MKFSIFNFQFSILLLTTYYLLLTTTAHAQVPIKNDFGFGNIGSLGEGTQKLITPVFEIAAMLVVAYFLVGAFKYLKAESNKEEVEGAKQMITHAIIGFLILMFSFLFLQFITQFFKLPGLDIIR